MDYLKVHDSIIDRARNRKLTGYKERHHIVPRCIGGIDEEVNIVELTAKEHYLIHKLLLEIYPTVECLKYAYWMMSHRTDGSYVGGKIYSNTKEFISKKFRHNVGTAEAISKMAKSKKGHKTWKGRKHTQPSKLKMREAALNRKINPIIEVERRRKISEGNTGREVSEETRQILSDQKKGELNPMYGVTGAQNSRSIKVGQYDKNNKLIKTWPNGRLAAEKLGLNYKAINACCNGKQKSSGGFIWKYER